MSCSTRTGVAGLVTFDSIRRCIIRSSGRPRGGKCNRGAAASQNRKSLCKGRDSFLINYLRVTSRWGAGREPQGQESGMVKAIKAVLLPGAIGALILYFSYHALA